MTISEGITSNSSNVLCSKTRPNLLWTVALSKLALILLTWRIWWACNNVSKRQMGFNSAFKGLMARWFHNLTSPNIHSIVYVLLLNLGMRHCKKEWSSTVLTIFSIILYPSVVLMFLYYKLNQLKAGILHSAQTVLSHFVQRNRLLLLLLLLALQPTVSFSLLSDSLPFHPFLT
jgi:hypothetical protein